MAGLRGLLEQRVGRVWVAGEVSNVHAAASGHLYFTLKDAGAQIRAAMFRSAARRLVFTPEEGLEVLVLAEPSIYEPRGDLQLLVRHLEPRGQGALQLAFEQLRARLEAEGLFAASRKRALPRFPRCVGLVTSARGAAIHDVIEVAGRRFPGIPLLLAAARVQGEGAEEELAAALEALQRIEDVDVILLVRGGGSMEDLQPYNTERIARAICACRVPIVAGVGHEMDVTIADLAADHRAPTPSAAAALAVPERAALRVLFAQEERRLTRAIERRLERARASTARAAGALRAHAPIERLRAGRARLDAAGAGLARAMHRSVERRTARLRSGAARLDALSPLAVLGRGYAIAQREDGAIVRSAAQAAPGDALRIRLGEGALDARVTASHRTPSTGEER